MGRVLPPPPPDLRATRPVHVDGQCGNSQCGHAWPLAVLPMDVAEFLKLAMQSRCPKCGGTRPRLVEVREG